MERRPHRAVKKPKPVIAPDQPDIEAKVREAEVSNILKKLKSGKTLNAREATSSSAEATPNNGSDSATAFLR